ncbi:MAG: rod shape-determining protein MreC [Janthinobacterium lividum]
MFRLSIQLRQALAKLTLPLLVALACCVMLLGQADRRVAEQARVAMSDAVAPLYSLLARPIDGLRGFAGETRHLVGVAAENQRLRSENMRLRRWYDVAVALQAENATLKANLNWIPEPVPSFVTARAVADTSQFYARSILLSVSPGQILANHITLSKDMVAVDAAGLVGRVTEVGSRSARVMLITDMSSRVPVSLEASHAAAMMEGTNATAPRLMSYPEDVHPVEGERVVTNNVTNVFPAGLPVGTVHYIGPNNPVVEPYAQLDHVVMVRLFDYGLAAITPPDSPGRPVSREGGQRNVPKGAVGGSKGLTRGSANSIEAPGNGSSPVTQPGRLPIGPGLAAPTIERG